MISVQQAKLQENNKPGRQQYKPKTQSAIQSATGFITEEARFTYQIQFSFIYK